MRTFIHLLLPVVLAHDVISAAERAKQPVVITTKPKFEQRGQFIDLIISDTNHIYEIGWAMLPQAQFVPVSLDTNRVYTFTVAEEPIISTTLRYPSQPVGLRAEEPFISTTNYLPKLRRVRQDGQTIYDIEVCELHKIKMEYKEVRIAYGLILPGPDEPSADVERQSFPHRREYSLGGCVSMPGSPKTERRYVCVECKAAYEKWKRDNRKAK